MRARLASASLRPLRWIGVVWIGALLAFAAGCPGDEPEAAQPQARGSGAPREHVEVYRGEMGGQVELPADFPGDFPIYPGARLAGKVRDTESRSLLVFLSTARPRSVYEYYVEELDARGWRIDDEREEAGVLGLSGSKEDARASLEDQGQS